MHKAKALVIHCIDFRFQEKIDHDLNIRWELVGQFDRISFPGASKDFETVLKAATTSIKLHDPNQIIIFEHEDCGAYGEDNSLAAHKANAEKLARALKKIKPSLEITNLIATFDGIKDL